MVYETNNTNYPGPNQERAVSHKPSFIVLVIILALLLSLGTAAIYAAAGLTLSTTSQTGSGGVTYVVEKAADSVVEISTEYKRVDTYASQFVTEGAGSGVVLTADGYMATCYHVIEGADTINVTLSNGNKYSAQIIGYDKDTDLALLKIEASGLTAATLADSDEIKVGQMAVAIGNPLGELGGTVTEGIISAKGREITIDGQTMTLLQTSAAVNSGNSGGGLFDSNGNLVGVVNAKGSGTDIEGLAFAIPSATVIEVIRELAENGYVSGRPYLGISVIDITSPMMAMRYRVNSLGVYVTEVTLENGLQVGDRIINMDGGEVASSSDVSSIIKSQQVGDVIEIVVERNGGQVALKVAVAEKNNLQ